ncbi:hypothetical protein SESBI_29782 [Sesbania bispinosa]|nr:hypothetical protein SESBI_29782 [Sesbania bispinosa]
MAESDKGKVRSWHESGNKYSNSNLVENISMAIDMQSPPMLWPTRITLSSCGRDPTNSINGSNRYLNRCNVNGPLTANY